MLARAFQPPSLVRPRRDDGIRERERVMCRVCIIIVIFLSVTSRFVAVVGVAYLKELSDPK